MDEKQQKTENNIPTDGLLRLCQIIGDRRKGFWPPLVPVSKSTWWAGVRAKRFPQPTKLGPRCTCWFARDILALIRKDKTS
jgi:prophage regulatory protein